ncbi:MAG: STAS domain-containing protein [Clostridia bacterium]|nr:STAS domain-containing protein [Clostridia bacterium]
MIITKTMEGTAMTVALEGRMDAVSAPQLEEALNADMETITDLTFDLEKLQYTSSAGLRVLLSAQKAMNKRGNMVIKNVCPDIMEIFDMVGFTDLLNIEE